MLQTWRKKIRNSNSRELYQKIFLITWPAFVELFMSSLFNVVDVVMVGRLSPEALSGVGLTGQPFNLLISAFAAVNVGTTTLVSWNIGAGNPKKASHILRQAILFNIVLGLVMTWLGYFFSYGIMYFMNKDPQTVEYATQYMKIVSLSIVFQALTMCITAALRGCGKTGYPMLYNMGANLLNVILNFLLIYGKLGFPQMGVRGAAVATSISRVIACLAALYVVFFVKKSSVRLSLKDSWKPCYGDIKNILHIGLPAAGEQGVIQTGLMLFSKIVAGLGVHAYAAHQIAINVNGMCFSVSQSFGVATTSLVGQSVGADDYSLAERYTIAAKRLARVVTAILALAIALSARPICSLFTDVQTVIDLAAPVFVFMAFVQFVQSVQMCTSGALRGSGDTMYPLYATIFGIWIFRVAAAYLLVVVCGLGLMGAWLAFFLDQSGRSFVVYLRFRSGKWKSMKAAREEKNARRLKSKMS